MSDRWPYVALLVVAGRYAKAPATDAGLYERHVRPRLPQAWRWNRP